MSYYKKLTVFISGVFDPVKLLANQVRLAAAPIITCLSLCAGHAAQAESLSEVYWLASQYDNTLLSQQHLNNAEKYRNSTAKSALLPRIDFDASYADELADISDDVLCRTGCDGASTESRYLELSLFQPIYNPKAWHTFKQSQHLNQKSEVQLQIDHQNLIIRVVDAYIDVLQAQDRLKTTQAESHSLNEQMNRLSDNVSSGVGSMADVYAVRASYDVSVARILSAQDSVSLAYEQLEVLTGKSIKFVTPFKRKNPIKMPEPSTRAEWVNLSIAHNKELKLAELQINAASENSKAKRAAHYPTLSLQASYQDVNSDSEYDPAPPHNNGISNNAVKGRSIGLHFNLPLYSGGGISASRLEAAEQHLASKATFQNTRRTVTKQARTFYLAAKTNIAKIKARQQAFNSSQLYLASMQDGYDEGLRSIIDVLDAQESLYRSELHYKDSRYQYVLDLVRLKQVSGQLSPETILSLNAWLAPTESSDTDIRN